MIKNTKGKNWLSSNEAKQLAKIRGCDLMHHREAGHLEFIKKGNSYFYTEGSINKIKKD